MPLRAPREIDTDPDILKLPVNCEPTSFDITANPKLGDTDAVTDPVAIFTACATCSANADNGISNNPLPLPLNIDADTEKSNCAKVFTERPLSGEIDAVAEPLDIKVAVNAGKLNNPPPSPINKDADILPVILTLPVNSEPLSADSTLKPY